MRTMRITLHGGKYDGLPLHVDHIALRVTIIGDDKKEIHYRRSECRDAENRQVFMMEHSRTLRGIKPCDLA